MSEWHLAPQSNPDVQVLHHHARHEGLFVGGVNAGQVGHVLPAVLQRCVPRSRLLHQLVAVGVPGGVAVRAGVRRRRQGRDAARWGGGEGFRRQLEKRPTFIFLADL